MSHRVGRGAVAMVCVLAAAMSAMFTAPPTAAQPAQTATTTRTELSPTHTRLDVESPAMDRAIRVDVFHPVGVAPRPGYYLLDGVDGPHGQSDWVTKTDVATFFADKNVNVVVPAGGRGSYYTDWAVDDAALGGRLRWETFLTSELAPLIDAEFSGTGANIIAGLSMGATAAAVLAARHPHLYRGFASFSGCPDTLSRHSATVLTESIAWVGGDPTNMWGPPGDPAWADHDPGLRVAALTGKTIWLSAGDGTPSRATWSDPDLGSAVTFGAVLEIGARACTQAFEHLLEDSGVAVCTLYRPGTHSWRDWESDLHRSWPVLAAAIS